MMSMVCHEGLLANVRRAAGVCPRTLDRDKFYNTEEPQVEIKMLNDGRR